jgi:hypothetical protein
MTLTSWQGGRSSATCTESVICTQIHLRRDLLADEVGVVEARMAKNMVWQLHSCLHQRVTEANISPCL